MARSTRPLSAYVAAALDVLETKIMSHVRTARDTSKTYLDKPRKSPCLLSSLDGGLARKALTY